jgi:hypothetical protein
MLGAACSALLLAAPAAPSADPDGEELARKVRDRPRATHGARVMVLELHDGRGRVRRRRLRNFWQLTGESKRLVFAVMEPPELEHDAFLAEDWLDSSRQDDMWIYRHQRQRAERIGTPKRGEPFLGSDFTLEDIKKEDRVELDEYSWKNLGRKKVDGRSYWLLEQTPASPELARNLGFARAVSHVDPERWLRRRTRYYAADGSLLRTIDRADLVQEEGAWVANRIEARSESGHRSVFRIVSRDNRSPLPEDVFTVRALGRERLGSARALPPSR